MRLERAVLVGIGLLTGCVSREAGVRHIAGKIQDVEFVRRLVDISRPAARLRDSELAESRLRTYSDETIERLYQALAHVTFFLAEQHRYVRLQQDVLSEKTRRHTRNRGDVKDMYKAYVGARLFDEARELRSISPEGEFPTIPEIVIASGVPAMARWRAYDVSDLGRTARLIELPLERGTSVVLTMWTGCSVSERALTDILNDGEFAERFRAHGLLLTERFDAVGVEKWKEHFKFSDVYIANKASDFPGLNFLASPQFFFLKGGKVVYEFRGWSSHEDSRTRASLRRGMKALGI